jgi:hypothetical protein
MKSEIQLIRRIVVGLDSVVGIAIRYGLQFMDPIPVGARFSAPVQTGHGSHTPSCTMGNGSLSHR